MNEEEEKDLHDDESLKDNQDDLGENSDSSSLENPYDEDSLSTDLENDETPLPAREGIEDNSDDSQEEQPEEQSNKKSFLKKNKSVAGQLTKKAAKTLFQKFKIPILLVLGFFFLVIVVIIVSSEDSNGKYIAQKCKTVTVTTGSGDEADSTSMSLEKYLISSVYSATKDFEEPSNSLYQALYIVLNTKTQNEGCSVKINPEVTDIYQFQELDEANEDYKYIQEQVKRVKDNVMVDKESKSLFDKDVALDGFCYTKKDDNYFTLKSDKLIPNGWVENNVTNWNFANCPCNDPSSAEDEDSCYKDEWNYPDDEEADRLYVDGGTGTGLSIYGAYYLSGQSTYQFILKEYYPDNDWEIYTNKEPKKPNKVKDCGNGNVPYGSTPLTRSEFITRVTNFLTSGRYADYAKLFIDNAGAIYDMGVKKGINPELIYIFARKETSFSDNTQDTNHFNYWGMEHNNDLDHGKFFNSFMEGVEYQYDYFVRRGSLEEIVKTYSYIGDYMANPGNAGAGGCYYMKVIYGANYSRCGSQNTCRSVKGGAGCEGWESTQEEKDAYIKWQAEQYIKHRQEIFKLGKAVCEGIDIDTKATQNIPSLQLKTALKDFLPMNKSSISEINESIKQNVLKAGVGTRAGVAVAATSLINFMARYDVRIPYTFGGGHGGYPLKGYGKPIRNYYGVDPDWGQRIDSYDYSYHRVYEYYGPDCSSFVNWAMKNGGMNDTVYDFTSQEYAGIGESFPMDGVKYIGKIGDVVYSSGHIRLIVSVNTSESYYITAESQSDVSPYKPDYKGISYQRMNFSDGSYRIVNLDKYYDNIDNHYNAAVFEDRWAQKAYS